MTLRPSKLNLLIAFAFAFGAGAMAGAASPVNGVAGPNVSLSDVPASNLYSIHGFFASAEAPNAVWSVISDYQGLAGILRGLKSSRVLERHGNRVLIEQVMEGHFLFFGRALRLRLLITEKPPLLIEFANADKSPFRTYMGAWRISPAPAGCVVDYTLQVSRGDLAPRFLERHLFQENSELLLTDLSREIGRRAAKLKVTTTKDGTMTGVIKVGSRPSLHSS
jgi:hypothetical protein